jgi:hypothetical protein
MWMFREKCGMLAFEHVKKTDNAKRGDAQDG